MKLWWNIKIYKINTMFWRTFHAALQVYKLAIIMVRNLRVRQASGVIH